MEPMDDVVNESVVATPELTEAVKKFAEAFAERSFSQRHEDLGKMIDCRLCGRRHREGDSLAKLSRAHGEQKFGDIKIPSRSVAFKKQRIHPHHNSRIRQFANLAEKIYTQDIAPYFHEEGDRLIRRAQRRAAIILRNSGLLRECYTNICRISVVV